MNKRNVWLEVLRRDWGINNRDELLETLNQMENNGHASYLKLIQQIISEEIVSVTRKEENVLINTKKDMHELTARCCNYLYFVHSNWDKFRNRTILAWDLGRNIALCRWGYDAGFFTEEEAWEKIMYYAKLIQPLYCSWEEYGYDYYMGRVFWASGFGEEAKYDKDTYLIYQTLINGKGLWHNLEWNIDLN